MCQFSHLQVDELVTLFDMGDGTKCLACGVESKYAGPAIYRGHRDNGGIIVDWFDVTGEWLCQCGEKIKNYIEPCHDSAYLETTPVYTFDDLFVKVGE